MVCFVGGKNYRIEFICWSLGINFRANFGRNNFRCLKFDHVN